MSVAERPLAQRQSRSDSVDDRAPARNGARKHSRQSLEPRPNTDKSGKKVKSEDSQIELGEPITSPLLFACPFCKYDAVEYGSNNGCSGWGNSDMDYLIRHHVMKKHRNMNRRRQLIPDERFERVNQLKIKDPKEKWRRSYAILFEVQEDEIPDQYLKTSTSALGAHDLEKMIRRNPSLQLPTVEFIDETNKLQRERSRERRLVRLDAEGRVSFLEGQRAALDEQIRAIKLDRIVREDKIDKGVDARLDACRARYREVLGHQHHTTATGSVQATEFSFVAAPSVQHPILGADGEAALETHVEHDVQPRLAPRDAEVSMLGEDESEFDLGALEHDTPLPHVCNHIQEGLPWCSECGAVLNNAYS